MAQSKAETVAQYLKELPEDRRKVISALRKVVLGSVDSGIEEAMSYGMIGYQVSLRVYPSGYHCNPQTPLPYMGIASQKSHIGIYMMGLYMDAGATKWFEKAWKASGKRLDMGKSCVRVKKLEDVPLDVLAAAIRRMPSKSYVAAYDAAFGDKKKPPKSASTKKAAKK